MPDKFLMQYSVAKRRASDDRRVQCHIRGVVQRLMSVGGLNPVAMEKRERRQNGCYGGFRLGMQWIGWNTLGDEITIWSGKSVG